MCYKECEIVISCRDGRLTTDHVHVPRMRELMKENASGDLTVGHDECPSMTVGHEDEM